MKVKVHMRVGYNKGTRQHQIAVNKKPVNTPFYSGNEAIATVAFALMLDIPDALFEQASQVIAELTIPESEAHIAAEVKQTLP